MASFQNCCAIHGRDNGCIEGRRTSEINDEFSVCAIARICTFPGWVEVCVRDNCAPLRGRCKLIIPAPSRMWKKKSGTNPIHFASSSSDILNAMRGLREHRLHMIVLDEVLGLKLFSFSRQLKMNPEIDDDHRVVLKMSFDL